MVYTVRIFQGRIVSVIQSGDGDRWTHGKAKQIEAEARVRAPKRTGRLRDSHVTLPTVGSNRYVKRYRVSAMAPYAIYPHEGTGIYGPRRTPVNIGKPMKIPGRNPNPGRVQGRSGTVLYSHKGQPAKRWLAEAAESVLRVT